MRWVMILSVYYYQSVSVTTVGPFSAERACLRQAEELRLLYRNDVTEAKTLCIKVTPPKGEGG